MSTVSYIAPPEEVEDGVTYIDISDLVEEEAEEEADEEEAEVVEVEEEEEVSAVKEIPTLKVTEGEKVSFPNLKATDPDGDKLTYAFSEPLDEDGEWETKEGDAGEYTATITVSDGKGSASQNVLIIIKPANQPPVIAHIDDITVDEGKTVSFKPVVTDPDGDEITIAYSGWMDKSSYTTEYDEADQPPISSRPGCPVVGRRSVRRRRQVRVLGTIQTGRAYRRALSFRRTPGTRHR